MQLTEDDLQLFKNFNEYVERRISVGNFLSLFNSSYSHCYNFSNFITQNKNNSVIRNKRLIDLFQQTLKISI